MRTPVPLGLSGNQYLQVVSAWILCVGFFGLPASWFCYNSPLAAPPSDPTSSNRSIYCTLTNGVWLVVHYIALRPYRHDRVMDFQILLIVMLGPLNTVAFGFVLQTPQCSLFVTANVAWTCAERAVGFTVPSRSRTRDSICGSSLSHFAATLTPPDHLCRCSHLLSLSSISLSSSLTPVAVLTCLPTLSSLKSSCAVSHVPLSLSLSLPLFSHELPHDYLSRLALS
jgi:hypothetical protein